MSLLFLDQSRSLLVCKACKYAINPRVDGMTKHMERRHGSVWANRDMRHQLIPETAEGGLVPGMLSLDQADFNDRIRDIQQMGYTPSLGVTLGWICNKPGCGAAFGDAKRAKEHCTASGVEHCTRRGEVSAIFYHKYYFAVTAPPGGFPTSKPPKTIAAASPECSGPVVYSGGLQLDAFARYKSERATDAIQGPSPTASGAIDLWGQHTGIPDRFKGQPMRELVQCSKILANDPGEARFCKLAKACLLDWDAYTIAQTPLVKQIFYAISDERGSQQELVELNDNTMTNYTAYWVRFLAYMIKQKAEQTDTGLPLSSTLKGLLSAFSWSSGPAPGTPSAWSSVQSFEAAMVAICRYIIELPITASKWHHPLVHFLGILMWKSSASCWRSGNHFTPALSGLIRCQRIIGVRVAIPPLHFASKELLATWASETTLPAPVLERGLASQPEPEPDHRDLPNAAREYCQQYLRPGSSTCFHILFNYRLVGQGPIGQSYAGPQLVWKTDRSALQYREITIPLQQYLHAVRENLSKAQDMLVHGLAFQERAVASSYLSSRSPGLFADPIHHCNPLFSFVDVRENGLADGEQRVIAWSQANTTDSLAKTIWNGHTVDSDAAGKYLRKVETFRQALLPLILILGGPPPRATELASITFRNQSSAQRNIFLLHGLVVVVYRYNKTDNLTQKPKIIPRFLPLCLSRLVVAYLADIVPFAEFLRFTLAGDAYESSNLVFEDQGQRWSTRAISGCLADSLKPYGLQNVTVAPFRDISIAFDREFIRKEMTKSGLFQALPNATLAGHSDAMEEAHYAIEAVDFGLDDDKIRLALKCQRYTHAMYDMDEPVPKHLVQPAAEVYKLEERLCAVSASLLSIKPLESIKLLESIKPSEDTRPSENMKLLTQKRRQSTSDDDKNSVTDSKRPKTNHYPHDDGFNALFIDGSLDAIPTRPSWIDRPRIKEAFSELTNGKYNISPGQEEAIDAFLDQKENIIVQMATGSGKSDIPLLIGKLFPDQVTIIVAPLLALRDSLLARANAGGVCARVWDNSSPSTSSVVVVTIEASNSGNFQAYRNKLIKERRLAAVVLDEAHMYATDTWRESIENCTWIQHDIPAARIPRIFLSGTLPTHIRQAVMRSMRIKDDDTLAHVSRQTSRSDIAYYVYPLPHMSLSHELMLGIVDRAVSSGGITLVFAKSLKEVESLYQWLKGQTIQGNLLRCCTYTSAVSDQDKRLALERLADRELDVVVATTAFGTGVSVSNIVATISYGGAYSFVDFIQQAGRGARGEGEYSKAHLFVAVGDRPMQPGNQDDPDQRAFHDFVTTQDCRRQVVARFLDSGAMSSGDCLECDNCNALAAYEAREPSATSFDLGVTQPWTTTPARTPSQFHSPRSGVSPWRTPTSRASHSDPASRSSPLSSFPTSLSVTPNRHLASSRGPCSSLTHVSDSQSFGSSISRPGGLPGFSRPTVQSTLTVALPMAKVDVDGTELFETAVKTVGLPARTFDEVFRLAEDSGLQQPNCSACWLRNDPSGPLRGDGHSEEGCRSSRAANRLAGALRDSGAGHFNKVGAVIHRNCFLPASIHVGKRAVRTNGNPRCELHPDMVLRILEAAFTSDRFAGIQQQFPALTTLFERNDFTLFTKFICDAAPRPAYTFMYLYIVQLTLEAHLGLH